MKSEDCIFKEWNLKNIRMVNVVLCGYRSWAIEIFSRISEHKNINIVHEICDYDEYKSTEEQFDDNIDLILFIGWSWIIPPKVTDKYLCLGIHPSDLPSYRGGSPIQNQIIDGITDTKVTLITLSSKLDGGDIWLKENLSLSGDDMDVVFDNIVGSSIKLLNNFFDIYPNIHPMEQDLSKGSFHKRRTPEQSLISREDLQNKSLLELYDIIRGLTDPYPNAYLEDKNGNRLLITGVKYVPKN